MKSLLTVIVVGAGIGLMLPTSQPRTPAVAAARTGPPPAEVRLERRSDGHFYVHGEVNGQLARFLVDTGASFVALTVEDAKRLGEIKGMGEGQRGPAGCEGDQRHAGRRDASRKGADASQLTAHVLEASR